MPPLIIIGCPPISAYTMPHHAVARIISEAPIQPPVSLVYIAPKVIAGAMHARYTKNEIATVLKLKFVISSLHHAPSADARRARCRGRNRTRREPRLPRANLQRLRRRAPAAS